MSSASFELNNTYVFLTSCNCTVAVHTGRWREKFVWAFGRIIVVSFLMYADISTEYKNYPCKVSSVQNKTAGEPCAQSVTKDGKKLILCRPYPILHWKHILFSARGKTPQRDCLEENMTKFFCPLCCTSLGVRRHCVIA